MKLNLHGNAVKHIRIISLGKKSSPFFIPTKDNHQDLGSLMIGMRMCLGLIGEFPAFKQDILLRWRKMCRDHCFVAHMLLVLVA